MEESDPQKSGRRECSVCGTLQTAYSPCRAYTAHTVHAEHIQSTQQRATAVAVGRRGVDHARSDWLATFSRLKNIALPPPLSTTTRCSRLMLSTERSIRFPHHTNSYSHADTQYMHRLEAALGFSDEDDFEFCGPHMLSADQLNRYWETSSQRSKSPSSPASRARSAAVPIINPSSGRPVSSSSSTVSVNNTPMRSQRHKFY